MGPTTVLPPLSRAWRNAEREHDEVVSRFRDTLRCFSQANWHREPAPGRWSAAALAPREVRPDLQNATTMRVEDVVARLQHVTVDALTALRDPKAAPFTHAYFGTLSPYYTLRLLSAHTRHHTQGLDARLLIRL